jgi:hypothetical protein
MRARALPLTGLLLAALASAPAAAVGAASGPSIARCALGGREPVADAFARGLAARERAYAAARPASERAHARRAYAAGAAAWVFGMPSVLLRATVARYPTNRLAGAARLADPSTTVIVAPNHDTTYAIAHIDLGQGPLVIDAPDTRGRYSVLQLMDTFTNAFAYVGAGRERERATSALLLPPGWHGAVPAGVRVIRSPSTVVWLLGRTLVDSGRDLAAARAVMAAYALTPLDAWRAGRRDRELVLDGFPASTTGPVTLPRGRAFLSALGAALAADPPPARDACALEALAARGVGPGRVPHARNADALAAGARAAPAVLVRARRRIQRQSARRNGGWAALPPRTAGAYGTRYALRAMVATIGLGANRAGQAVYEAAERDADDRPLDGRHRYELRFAAGARPPVRAFWSVTLYDRRLRLWPNPLGRYVLGDRSPGLPRHGPLTVRVSHAPPKRGRARWLPAPAGAFRLYLRLYEPRAAVVDGRWRPARIVRVG